MEWTSRADLGLRLYGYLAPTLWTRDFFRWRWVVVGRFDLITTALRPRDLPWRIRVFDATRVTCLAINLLGWIGGLFISSMRNIWARVFVFGWFLRGR